MKHIELSTPRRRGAVTPRTVRANSWTPRMSRGVGLLDGLIALAILAFGMLGMTRFQSRLVMQGTDAQTRIVATQLGDELLNLALVDPGNGGCYTVPAAGACADAGARAFTAAWAVRAQAALPGTVTVGSTLDAVTGQLTVLLTWTGKGSGDPHQMQAVTDVRL